MRQNVNSYHADRWYTFIDTQVMRGYVFRWRLVLECGHEVFFTTPPQPSRDVNNPPAPPAWMECRECDRCDSEPSSDSEPEHEHGFDESDSTGEDTTTGGQSAEE